MNAKIFVGLILLPFLIILNNCHAPMPQDDPLVLTTEAENRPVEQTPPPILLTKSLPTMQATATNIDEESRYSTVSPNTPVLMTPRPLATIAVEPVTITPDTTTILILPPALVGEGPTSFEEQVEVYLIPDLAARLAVPETAVDVISIEPAEVQFGNPCGVDSTKEESGPLPSGIMIGQIIFLSVASDSYTYIMTGTQAQFCGISQ